MGLYGSACSCPDGFRGDQCERKVQKSKKSYILKHHYLITDHQMLCLLFKGPCSFGTCGNKGKCVSILGTHFLSWTCYCDTGFSGYKCNTLTKDLSKQSY